MTRTMSWITWFFFGAIASTVSITLGARIYNVFSDSKPSEKDGENIFRRIPRGYEDSTQAGSQAALQDIKNNDIKYGIYGLVSGSLYEVYGKYGVTPMLLGCMVGGPGSSFWEGYNQTVLAELRARGLTMPESLRQP
jgi:hypothetical protein